MDETATAVADAPASAPSSDAPSSTSSADRPSSFVEAFTRAGQAETAPATPDDSQTAGEQPAAAIAPPPSLETPPVAVPTPEAKGPIPFDRHESILKNARAKTEAELTQKFQAQYGPHVALGKGFQDDPVGTAVQVIGELSQHPEFGPQIISALARTLGSRRKGAVPEPDQAPQADLQTADGTLVFSAEQLAKREAYQRQQMMAEVDQRLHPLQSREEQAQAQEQLGRLQAAAHDRMGKALAPYLNTPEMVEHKPAFVAKVKALIEEDMDPAMIPGLAYTQVLREVVMPRRAAQSQQTLVAQAVAKSTGSTTAPGTAPAAPQKRPTSMAEAFSTIRL